MNGRARAVLAVCTLAYGCIAFFGGLLRAALRLLPQHVHVDPLLVLILSGFVALIAGAFLLKDERP